MIYRNTQIFAFKVLQQCSSWEQRNGLVQISFFDTKQKHVCRKICKLRKVFGCVSGACYFQCQLSCEVREMSEVVWVKLYCKIGALFRKFLLALRLPARKSEIKKSPLLMSTGTCGKYKNVARNNINNIFKKRITI